ncbi:hypothetical protein CPB85DRAFT_1531493 [Mucidula mucida]|nr:hypothetical protein CPB85DRAFT_1531493 [Mucidula mucida]
MGLATARLDFERARDVTGASIAHAEQEEANPGWSSLKPTKPAKRIPHRRLNRSAVAPYASRFSVKCLNSITLRWNPIPLYPSRSFFRSQLACGEITKAGPFVVALSIPTRRPPKTQIFCSPLPWWKLHLPLARRSFLLRRPLQYLSGNAHASSRIGCSPVHFLDFQATRCIQGQTFVNHDPVQYLCVRGWSRNPITETSWWSRLNQPEINGLNGNLNRVCFYVYFDIAAEDNSSNKCALTAWTRLAVTELLKLDVELLNKQRANNGLQVVQKRARKVHAFVGPVASKQSQTKEHAYSSDSFSNAPSNSGNVDGQFSGSQASYSYGSDESPDDATPSLYPNYQQNPLSYPDNSHSAPSFANNGTGYDQNSIYNNPIQSYAYVPSQQFPPTNGQVESTTEERHAGQKYLLPNPRDATSPSVIPQSRVETATTTTSYAQSLPVPATSLSSPDAPAIPKGRQSKTTQPAALKAAKAPAARGRRAAPKALAAEQESAQGVNGDLAAKVPAKRGRKRKAPLPEPSPATVIPTAVTQPVSGSADVQDPAATQEKFKAASVDQSQAASASNATVQSATRSSRTQSLPAGDQAFEASRSSTTLYKRKRDEQVDDAQRDRDLMPPPAAPRANFSIGKGKARSIEPPAQLATNNQVNFNVVFPQAAQMYNMSAIQFVLPSGLIALAPRLPPRDLASRGAVWIMDQTYEGVAWPARLHTNEELADFAYNKAVNLSCQRIIYLPRHPMTDGKVQISSLILISLGSPVPLKQVRFHACNTARVFPPEQVHRFLEQLYTQESCRRSMMFELEENSSGFRGPIHALKQTPSYVGTSGSNRQFSGVQQAMWQSNHSPLLFPGSSSGYPSGPTSNAQNHRLLPQERAGAQQAPYLSSTFSFASEPSSLPTSSDASAAGQSTALQELPYPFSSYPSGTVDPVTTSGSSTPAETTASPDSTGYPSSTQDTAYETPDSVPGDDDFWASPLGEKTELKVDDNSQRGASSDVPWMDSDVYKEIMELTDEQFRDAFMSVTGGASS